MFGLNKEKTEPRTIDGVVYEITPHIAHDSAQTFEALNIIIFQGGTILYKLYKDQNMKELVRETRAEFMIDIAFIEHAIKQNMPIRFTYELDSKLNKSILAMAYIKHGDMQ